MFLLAMLTLALWIFWKSNKYLFAEKQRLAHTIESLGNNIQYLESENGKLAAQSDVLTLQLNELKDLFPKTIADIKAIGVKPSRINQVSSIGFTHQRNIVTHIYDSILYDTIPVKAFRYSDPWLNLNGIAIGDSQKVQLSLTDTLIQVVYKGERYRSWLWFFSKRKLQQRAQLANPYSTISYQKTITIQAK